jgi:integrase
VSDLLRLKVRDVKSDWLNVIESKTKKRKSSYISPERRELKEYIKNNGLKADDYLFPSTAVNKKKAVSRAQVYKIFRVNAKKLGILGVIAPHSCRKNYARDLYAKTKDVYAVQKALNHSQLSDTILYLYDIGVQPEVFD